MNNTIDRRRLLQAAGLSAGTLFLPSLLGDRAAHAQGAPKRIVFFLTAHGPVTGRWNMTRPGLPVGDAEFPLDDADPMSFSETLRPLHAHRKDLLVLDGLSYASTWGDDYIYNHHGLAGDHKLSGNLMSAKKYSVDQIIADGISVPGRFKYLYYTNGTFGSANGTSVFDASGAPVANERLGGGGYLKAAFDRVFGMGLPGPTAPGPLSPAELSRQRRKNVLGLVQDFYPPILSRLGSEDRAKLQRHRDMIADLEKQVVALAAIKCEKPAAPASDLSTLKVAELALSQLFPVAMACDLTRVAVLSHDQIGSVEVGAPFTDNLHQEIAHASESGQNAIYMTNYYKLHAQQFAKMIEAFKSVPEGNGTMLDNSLLVWLPEHANGWHDHHQLMTVIAGSGAGAMRTGRYVKYAQNITVTTNTAPTGRIGPPHNKLLVSLAKAMGVDRNAVGGTITTTTRWLPKAVDLSGPLPLLG